MRKRHAIYAFVAAWGVASGYVAKKAGSESFIPNDEFDWLLLIVFNLFAAILGAGLFYSMIRFVALPQTRLQAGDGYLNSMKNIMRESVFGFAVFLAGASFGLVASGTFKQIPDRIFAGLLTAVIATSIHQARKDFQKAEKPC